MKRRRNRIIGTLLVLCALLPVVLLCLPPQATESMAYFYPEVLYYVNIRGDVWNFTPAQIEQHVHGALQYCYAVVDATVVRAVQAAGRNEQPRGRYLLWVHDTLAGELPRGTGRLLWLESRAWELQRGTRYVLTTSRVEMPWAGRYTGGADHQHPYWQVMADGTLQAVGTWAQRFTHLAEANLPATYTDFCAYLATVQRPQVYQQSWVGYYSPQGYGWPVQSAVRQSHIVARGKVVRCRENTVRVLVEPEDYLWMHTDLAQRLQTQGADLRAQFTLYTDAVFSEGDRCLVLLRCAEEAQLAEMPAMYAGQFYPTARKNSIIPMSDTRKVRRVYRALGLEMPQE